MRSILVAALMLVAVCSLPWAAGAEPIAKITVKASGVVLLDGAATTLPALDERLRALKASGGVVWYHRENPTAPLPANGDAVVKMIIKHQLPVSMSARPDFSDWVDNQGVSHARTK